MVLNNKTSEFSYNLIFNILGRGIAGISFILLDILIAHTTSSVYNEWTFLLSIIFIIRWITRFGIDSAGKSYVATNPNESKLYFSAAVSLELKLVTPIGIILFVILYSTREQLVSLFNYPNLITGLTIGILYSCLYGIFSVYKECYIGIVDFRANCILTSIEYIGYLFFSFIIIVCGKLEIISLSLLLSLLFPVVFLLIRQPTGISPFIKYDKKQSEILNYAKYMVLASVGDMIVTEIDTLMLGTMYTSEVGIYGIGKNLMSKLSVLPLAICTSLMPKYTLIDSRNATQKKRSFIKNMLQVFVLLILLCFIIICISDLYVNTLYGKEYSMAVSVIRILSIYFVFYSLAIFGATFLTYHKWGKTIIVSQSLMISCDLILNYYFIPLHGSRGAAWASVVSVAVYAILLLFYCGNFFKKCFIS